MSSHLHTAGALVEPQTITGLAAGVAIHTLLEVASHPSPTGEASHVDVIGDISVQA